MKNKITQKLGYTAQLLSTRKVIEVPTFKVDVESVLRSHGYTFAVASASLIHSSINDAVIKVAQFLN